MDDVILLESEDSENSVVEVEVPRKPTPPLIQIEEEEILLNVTQKNSETILAKNFINEDKVLGIKVLEMGKNSANSQFINCPVHWTPDMIKFYDDDWGDEDKFVVEKLQEKMDKSPSLWEISKKDMLPTQNKIRSRKVRCWNCHQLGHHYSLCPDPPQIVKCHMCGSEGHAGSSCPNSKCLNCGSYSHSYVYCCFKCRNLDNHVCSRCRLTGHNFINCTDHWRLFHSTIGTTSVTQPKKQAYKSDKDLWCCNCGKQGHQYTYCKQRKDSASFKDTLPFVVSYKKAFKYKDFHNNSSVDTQKKKSKSKGKDRNKSDKILRLNPMHKAIWKDRIEIKNKLKVFKKKRRRKERRKMDHF